jgi:hypothetical protein
MKRAALPSILVAVVLLALGVTAEAQQPIKTPRIGYISGPGDASNPGPYVEALRQGLRDLGYVESKNFIIEYRGAGGKKQSVIRVSLTSLYNSKSMSSSFLLYQQFSLLSRPRRLSRLS